MFDWDQDFDEVTQTRKLVLPVAEKPRETSRLRKLSLRLAVPLALVLAIGGGAVATPGLSSASLTSTSLTGWIPGFAVTMPAGLRAYDQGQFDAFRRGIAGFTDAELLEFERVTLAGHHGPDGLLADYTHDALLLTHQEIEHRGLARPVASLRFSARLIAAPNARIAL